MRQIRKNPEPTVLAEWRSRYQSDVNFGYDLLSGEVREVVIDSLLSEQGWLCAYTGRRVGKDGCHIEHLKPQTHCERGEDVAYSNLVTCHPAPNTGEAPYGAHPKQDWPPPTERWRFVSPLDDNCEGRFQFNLRGEIGAANSSDLAAETTIAKLKLDHSELTQLRREAIDATLKQPRHGYASLSLPDARRRLEGLENAEQPNVRLEAFCFALKQALRKHIARLEAIRRNKRQRP